MTANKGESGAVENCVTFDSKQALAPRCGIKCALEKQREFSATPAPEPIPPWAPLRVEAKGPLPSDPPWVVPQMVVSTYLLATIMQRAPQRIFSGLVVARGSYSLKSLKNICKVSFSYSEGACLSTPGVNIVTGVRFLVPPVETASILAGI
jgi:hypothetical protein